MLRIFFATDIHGSNICWKKFVGAADFYKAVVLVLGGDMTGKALIPIICQPDGKCWTDLQDNHMVLKNPDEVNQLEKLISDKGYYPVRIEQKQYDELMADPAKLSRWTAETFDRLMRDRVAKWMDYADQKLSNSNIRCCVCPGNDDDFDIDEVIGKSKMVSNVEGKVVSVDGGYELLGSGWSTPTPWKTFRECSEEELSSKIEQMVSQVHEPAKCVFDLHDPPISSGLDEAPDLTENLNLKLCGKITKPVGSKAVRQAIEKFQPLLGLHGHIHESKGITTIGRTLCINPGSIYEEGTLLGAVVDLDGSKVKRYYTISG